MIRFVDLRDQDIGARFAFYNTISDTWIEAEDLGTCWQTWPEFRAAYSNIWNADFLDRLEGLTPAWAHRPEDEKLDLGCVLCRELPDGPDHKGTCMTRSALVGLLAGSK